VCIVKLRNDLQNDNVVCVQKLAIKNKKGKASVLSTRKHALPISESISGKPFQQKDQLGRDSVTPGDIIQTARRLRATLMWRDSVRRSSFSTLSTQIGATRRASEWRTINLSNERYLCGVRAVMTGMK
jgi:hypothetical protein